MVYDPMLDALVAFGGNSMNEFQSTWEFSNGSWTNLTATVSQSPLVRMNPMAAYDPLDGTVVMFGGCGFGPEGIAALNDTWEFDGRNWSQVAANGPAPEGRMRGNMVFDAADGYLVLTGGGTCSATPPPTGVCALYGYVGTCHDIWAFRNESWTLLSPSDGALELDAAMTYDPLEHQVLLSGGCLGSNCEQIIDFTFSYGCVCASASASPLTGVAPLTVRLTASARGGAPPYTFSWTTGDGAPSASGATVDHTFRTGGTFHATLIVRDANNTNATQTVTIRVAAPPAPPASVSKPAPTAPTLNSDDLLLAAGAVSAAAIVVGFALPRRRRRV
jgi:hypothetical protein